MLRALRMLPSTSRRLNHYVLYKAVHGFFTSNNATRDFLLPFLEEVSGVKPAQECGLGLRHTGAHTPPWVAVSHPGDLSSYLPQQRHEAKQPLLILICSLNRGTILRPCRVFILSQKKNLRIRTLPTTFMSHLSHLGEGSTTALPLKLHHGGCREQWLRDFPGGPVVKTPRLHCRGCSWIRGQGAKIPHALQCGPTQKRAVVKSTGLGGRLNF